MAALWDGPLRPTELQATLPTISQRVLLSTLRAMIDRGLVERQERPAVPVSRVDYSLTAAAYGLRELLDTMSVTVTGPPD